MILKVTGTLLLTIYLSQVAPLPTFEAATVKRNTSAQRGGGLPPPVGGRFNAVNLPLKSLISYAYHVPDMQLSGATGWMSSEPYDVVAKADGDGSENQIRLMLQTLLRDQFKLKIRRESRSVSHFSMTIAKGGLKMKAFSGDCVSTPEMPCGGFRVRNRSQMSGRNVPLFRPCRCPFRANRGDRHR